MKNGYASELKLKDGVLHQTIGEYKLTSPKMPSKDKFLNGSVKKKAEQKFTYTPVPSYNQWTTMSEDDKVAWENQEWDRRDNGVWFYNNGNPTWITGVHYYFLNYYYIKGKKPEYRDADRTFFWVWDYCVKHPKCFGLLFITRRQSGKCLARGTKVRMFDGSLKNVEDIQVGEQVMGVDSTPRNVLNTHSGIDDMYEVVQNRGINYIVNSNHIISLRRNKSKQDKRSNSKGDDRYVDYPDYGQVVNIPVTDLKAKAEKFKNSFSGYRTGYELPKKEVRLDPYFLGAWLGDGNAHRPGITSPDPEIVNMVYTIADSYGLIVTPNQNASKTCPTYIITAGSKTGGDTNQLLKDFRHYGLFESKRIPDDYLRNSREVRMQVLAGIVDTDGYQANGFYEIIQKSEELSYDIKELAISLGFYCSVRKVQKSIKSIAFTGEYYKINICGDIDTIPVRVARKKAVLKSNKYKDLTRIDDIKPVGKGEYFGFELDGDHLFLLEDGTVTHNSFKGGCIALEFATRTMNKHIGIQSKSEEDAKDLFKRAIVESWLKLPPYFSPVFSNTNSMEIKSIRFEAMSTRGKGARKAGGGVHTEAGLNTWIDYESSKVNAYDGDPYMGYYLHDEIFKKQDHDPTKRWSIVKKIFKQQGKVIAKSFHTSSVGEEIEEKGVERANKLWEASNPNKLLDNGETKSGLFRLFQPGYIGHMWDEYGMDKIEESTSEFLATRKGFEQAQEWDELLGEKRANPFTIEEALLPEGDGGVYNNLILADTVDKINGYIRTLGQGDWPRLYNLEWVDIAKTKVRAVEDSKKGRFMFSWLPPREEMLNKVASLGSTVTQYGLQTLYAPKNDVNFGIAIDPVDHRAVKDEARSSKLSANGMWKYDPLNEQNIGYEDYWPSGSIIFRYAQRVHIHTMYEDMVMACHFLGCQMLFENNKPGIENYFINRGYKAFLAGWEDSEKKEKYGIAASAPTIAKYVEITGKWIEGTFVDDPTSLLADWRRCPFPDVLNQWMHFDPNNTKKFDEAVSASYTLMHCNRYMPVAAPAENTEEFNFYY